MNQTTTESFDPLHSSSPVIVYIDYKSPYAFVAIEPTYALEDALGVKFDWRPITLDIPSYLGSAKLDKTGKVTENNRSASQWSGVKYAYKDARRYAKLQGHALRGTEKIWDTRLVHMGMLWVKAQGHDRLRQYSNLVYPPFWRRELDVEDPAVITGLIEQSGADSAGFTEYTQGVGGETHDRMQEAIFAAGIFGVPTYVVAGHKFFGREHLPSVRWHVEREHQGVTNQPHPDIGYRAVATTK